jgi:hypothetical protein
MSLELNLFNRQAKNMSRSILNEYLPHESTDGKRTIFQALIAENWEIVIMMA